jgi:type I restriction enzyme, S subunit
MVSETKWKSEKLGNLVELINGRAFKPSEWSNQGLPIIRISNLNGDPEFNYFNGSYDEKHFVTKGDLLFSWSGNRGTSFGPHIWRKQDGLLNQHIFKVIPNEKIEKEFLYYELLRLTQVIEQNAHGGSGLVHIKKSDLVEFNVFLPPKSIQRRIAAILSSVDEAIEKTEAIIEQTEKVKKGLMQQLLTKGIGHTKFKKTEIGEIPEEWEVKNFDEVMVLQRGFDLPVHKRNDGPYPVMSANGSNGYHDEYKVKGPGIITGRSGTIGKVHYIEGDFWPLNTTLYVKEMYDNYPQYLYYFLVAFKLERFSTGTGVPTLNRNIVHKEKIAVPPRKEQEQIATILRTLDDKYEIENKKLHQLQNIKKGLMQVLLTGEVRVKVEDEVMSQ